MSSIKNIWLKDKKIARNIPRQIDDVTMIDLLEIFNLKPINIYCLKMLVTM